VLFVAQRVHGLPETTMHPGRQLTVRRQALQGFVFPHRVVALDQFQHAGFQYEKTTVDQAALGRRLFLERDYLAALGNDAAKTRRGPNAGHRGFAAVIGMEGEFRADIDVGQTIPVGHAKWFAGIQEFANLQKPPAGHGFLAGIHQSHFPGFTAAVVILDPVRRHVECDVRLMQEIIREVLLDHVALVAEADDELADAEGGIQFHDVP
jgi:hypothetical protein